MEKEINKNSNFRKCVGCGELKPRGEMLKITKQFETGELVFNPNSKTFGRSAYLCYNQNCIEKALKKNKINRALKVSTIIEKSLLLGFLEKE